MTTNPTSIYGKGISTPLRLVDGSIARSKEEQKVLDAITDLLTTSRGERPHVIRRGVLYGVRSNDALFENLDTAIDILTVDTEEAIRLWEPRVILLEVKVSKVEIDLMRGVRSITRFKYRTTNREDNAVVDYTKRTK